MVTDEGRTVTNTDAPKGEERRPRVAVVGYGNIGHHAVEALLETSDLELAGVVRRNPKERGGLPAGITVVGDVRKLGRVDVALLCVPSRNVPATAAVYLEAGINTVDSFDIHGEPLVKLRRELHHAARTAGRTAVVSAGWDPGTDSIMRGLFEAMTPRGITYTDFGPGVSMGHTTVVRNMPGVKDGLSITVPTGQGVHRRLVYVEPAAGADFAQIREHILNDAYFANDDTRVMHVDSVRDLLDVGHGVRIQRKGVSGRTHNQQLSFDMRINNPALTAQVMVAAARAAVRQRPGAYTLLEVPVIDLLPGHRDDVVRRLV